MTSVDWLEWDEDLLTGLGDVRARVNKTLGTTYNRAFYTDFAARLSNETGRDIRAKDVTDRVKRLKEIYKSCKAANIFQHEVMDNAEYAHHMNRCFGEPVVDPIPVVPKNLTASRNVRSRLSSRGAGSGAGSGASVSNEQMHVNAPTVLDRVLAELHTRNRERFDGHKLTLFTRLLKRDPQLSSVFLMLQNHQQMLDFVDDQQLELVICFAC
ncbi:hypothetical protein CTI12_AA487800 [Artemisia annua]|uniref:Uncharacterized protein n=1 Tax=Artemisia annua TaxID=35608 RepID=A0A2U1LDY6_ARTAN|nr:hypothetical protein CTI12_AA487800 [Artemisia annua]